MNISNKKCILIFALDYYPGEVGGAEIALKEITDRISPEEYAFHLITLHYDTNMLNEEQMGNVRVHRIGFGKPHPTIEERKSFPLHFNKHLFQFTAAWKAMQLHRVYHFDAVWAMMAHACGVPAALFTLLYKDVPLILTLQEGDPPEYIERTMRPLWPLFTRAFTHARTIQVISSFLGAWAKRMGSSTEPIRIPNGVDVAHFMKRASDEKISEIQHRLGKQSGDVFLVTTSRLVHKNGIDSVIKALPLLPQYVHFIIFGNGPDRATLETLALSLGVAERTHFMGTIAHHDMPPYIQACDIFIRPSRSEGMGNSFVEAMAAGVPVIATQAGGIADFLFDAKRNPDEKPTGWAVDIDAPDQIRDAVLEICRHPAIVRDVTNHARTTVLHGYDWDTVATSMQALVFDATLK